MLNRSLSLTHKSHNQTAAQCFWVGNRKSCSWLVVMQLLSCCTDLSCGSAIALLQSLVHFIDVKLLESLLSKVRATGLDRRHSRQSKYSGTLRCVKSNQYYIFWVCACSLGYPARNAHAPHCIVTGDLSDSAVLSHTVSKTAQFSRKKLLNVKCVFLVFCATFVWNVSKKKKKNTWS